jgi:Rrf2 family protein
MDFSNKSEYALLAMLELAAHYRDGDSLQIRYISAQQNIPDRYLEQLLADLRRGGLLHSERGAKGGYRLARSPKDITIMDVIACMEEIDLQPTGSKTGDETVDRAAISEIWNEVRQSAFAVLQNYTLQDLLDKAAARQQLNTMYYI